MNSVVSSRLSCAIAGPDLGRGAEAGPEQQVVPVDKQKGNTGHGLKHRLQERLSHIGRAVVP